MDYRNSTIAVLDIVDGCAIVWQVTTARLKPQDSPLSGAWVFDADDHHRWETLTCERRTLATPEAAQWLSGQGWRLGLPIDAEQLRQAVMTHLESVQAAYSAHAATRPSLKEPQWPTPPHPLQVPTAMAQDPDRTRRALQMARWLSGLVAMWTGLEETRTAKTREYLHHLGGPQPLPLPLLPGNRYSGNRRRHGLTGGITMNAALSLDFVAIDFETANSNRSSPCAAGLVRFRSCEPVDQWHQLMRPPAGMDHFDRYNTRVHGITAEMVADQPRFGTRWPQMREFIGGDPPGRPQCCLRFPGAPRRARRRRAAEPRVGMLVHDAGRTPLPGPALLLPALGR